MAGMAIVKISFNGSSIKFSKNVLFALKIKNKNYHKVFNFIYIWNICINKFVLSVSKIIKQNGLVKIKWKF